MGKISKYSNLYDKDVNFLHKPGKYTIKELEELIDTLDENSKEFASATAILMHMYEQKGDPHRDELIQNLIGQSKTKTTKAEIVDALKDIDDEKIGENGPSAEGCISGPIKIVGGYRRRSRLNNTDTTISTSA